jgi:hypothetical protein
LPLSETLAEEPALGVFATMFPDGWQSARFVPEHGFFSAIE